MTINQFERPYLDLNAVASGNVYLEWKVEGFWSNPVNLTIQRGYGDDNEWEFKIRHSSGYNDDIDPIDREENFAFAVLDAIEWARELQQPESLDWFEQTYQARKEFDDARRAKRKAEYEKELEADPALGLQEANGITQKMRNMCKEYGDVARCVSRKRASQNTTTFVARHTGSVVTFRMFGERRSRKDVAERLADQSQEYEIEKSSCDF